MSAGVSASNPGPQTSRKNSASASLRPLGRRCPSRRLAPLPSYLVRVRHRFPFGSAFPPQPVEHLGQPRPSRLDERRLEPVGAVVVGLARDASDRVPGVAAGRLAQLDLEVRRDLRDPPHSAPVSTGTRSPSSPTSTIRSVSGAWEV